MTRRLHIYMICLLFAVSFLFIIDIQIRHLKSQENTIIFKNIKTLYETRLSTEMDNISKMSTKNFSCGSPDINKVDTNLQDKTCEFTDIINILLEKARLKIKYDITRNNFSLSGANILEDLVMESGGQPLRSLIVSTWRSGSSFTGDLLLNARPGTYYYYEPLFKYGTKQFKISEEAIEPIRIVKRMLQCNYSGYQDIFDCERKHYRFGEPSTRMWDYCQFGNNTELCFNADFATKLCKLFPFITVKLVRLRLRLVKEILDDNMLNVKVLLLVRDPRGVMQSRLDRPACKRSPDCWDPAMLCADMISDYEAAGRLLQQYPGRLMVVRFEELALKLNATSDRILDFLKVERTQTFDNFLQSHTNKETTGPHSTIRVTKNVPYKWTTALDFSYVNEIQMACSEAMNLWGYKMALDETHMTSKDFNPVGDYTIY